jgi:hypothetical protein
MTRDPRVDTYIENAAEFAQPILRHTARPAHEREITARAR